MVNYVEGIPFPYVDANDPDVAIKLMYNHDQRLAKDDGDARNFGCVTGSLDVEHGLQTEREYLNGHFRRLWYTGRLYVEPKPTWETPEHIRYREQLYPLLEPFDLKGAGFTYNRYLTPNRQDDSWLYLPQTRRVRRLSTAQRSEGVFGQDIDLDSYGGFAGNPAWFDWQLLGRKKAMTSFHNRHHPPRWSAKPADFMFDDTWEARDVWVLAARALIPGYNFSLRIIYLDAEAYLIPFSEIYDHNGQLWRGITQQWNIAKQPREGADTTILDYETWFLSAFTLYDMLTEHATRCSFPAQEFADSDSWYFNVGAEGGMTPEVFDVSTFIEAGR
jgi:hypothetical protein